MPRAKKASSRRQGSRSRDIGLVPAASGKIEVPKPAKGWLVATKSRWAAYWGSNVAQIVERDSDLPALLRLFGYYDEMERSERALRKRRFVKGSEGQPRLNPAAKYVTDLEGPIRQLEDRFGLNPQARLRLGVDFAAAHRSLKDLNDSFDQDEEAEDPRDFEVIEGEAAS